MAQDTTLSQLLTLSHWLGDEARGLAILGEGNTSALAAEGNWFYVKASGTRLVDIPEDGFVRVDMQRALTFLAEGEETDEATQAALKDCRVDPAETRMPSVETFLHAYLLSLPGIRFVGHTHPTSVNAVTCSRNAEQLIAGRLFPDEIVCCGVAPLWVPYTDPGLPLARALKARCEAYMTRYEATPKVILMQNHGLIAPSDSVNGVQSATLMFEKTSRIIIGAHALGGLNFMTAEQVQRIATRPDEKYRQQIIAAAQGKGG